MVAGTRAGNKEEVGVSQRAQLPARAHWPAAVQPQVPSPAPCQSPGLLHLGLQCKEMALSRVMPRGQHLEKGLDTSAVLAHAGTPGRGISASTWCKLGNPLDQGSQCRHREACGACGMLTGCSLQQSQWGLGQAGTSTPHAPPWFPVQQGSWLQTGWQWHCGRTGAWH